MDEAQLIDAAKAAGDVLVYLVPASVLAVIVALEIRHRGDRHG